MGYRGKLRERESARALRAEGLTLGAIATRLGVSKSSVSLWVRDVEFVPCPDRPGRRRAPNSMQLRKAAEIDAARSEAADRLGVMDEQAFLAAGAALYAGEGTKGGHSVGLANSDSRLMGFFCVWLRRFFDIDESRLRMRVYLHVGLDLDIAQEFWSRATDIPLTQFRAAYWAKPKSLSPTKHEHGCAYLIYSCVATHRRVMALVDRLLTSASLPG